MTIRACGRMMERRLLSLRIATDPGKFTPRLQMAPTYCVLRTTPQASGFPSGPPTTRRLFSALPMVRTETSTS